MQSAARACTQSKHVRNNVLHGFIVSSSIPSYSFHSLFKVSLLPVDSLWRLQGARWWVMNKIYYQAPVDTIMNLLLH
jgi:hypothetical protein